MALAGDFVTVTLDDSGGAARQFADGEITAVDLGLTQNQLDVSGAGHAAHKTLNGQLQAPVTLRGLLTTTDVTGTHTVINGAFQAGSQVTLAVDVGQNTAPVSGDPHYEGEFVVQSYKPVIAPGGQITFEAVLQPVGSAAPGWAADYLSKLLGIQSANLIGLWPMDETSGSVADDKSDEANDGAYTGVTLNDSTFTTGDPVGRWDGANDYNNIYSAALDTDFDEAEGTFAIWLKVSGAGVWSDATERYFMHLKGNATNFIRVTKTTTTNQVQCRYEAAGTAEVVSDTSLAGTTDWAHLALTWSKSADEVKFYVNGSQVGATQTGLATWTGGGLNSTQSIIGAKITTPSNVWDGWLAYAALWNTPLSASEISQVATV